MGKFFRGLWLGLGTFALITCGAIAVLNPNAYIDTFTFKSDEETETTQSLPYIMNFSKVTNLGSGYKSSVFTDNNSSKEWYCSWGNGAGASKDNEGNTISSYSFMLGWNSNGKPSYSSYLYQNVYKSIDFDTSQKEINCAVLLMGFDLYQNHLAEFQVIPHDSMTLSTNETKLLMVKSNDSGDHWKTIKTLNYDDLKKDSTLKLENEEVHQITTYTRYGLVLLSKADVCRLEINSFYAVM